jgi:hypothetical protein
MPKQSKQKSEREVEIEQQIAHLQWLKNQNERSYKKTMQKTRVTQQNDQILKIAVDKNNEKFVRMKNVIKDELAKPLVLSDAESYALEKQNLKRHEYFEKVFLNVTSALFVDSFIHHSPIHHSIHQLNQIISYLDCSHT